MASEGAAEGGHTLVATRVRAGVAEAEESTSGERAAFALSLMEFGKGALYVWVGPAAEEARMGSMAAAFAFHGTPTSTRVFPPAPADDDASAAFARRLCAALDDRPCFASFNASPAWPPLLVAHVQAGALRQVRAWLAE
jgi:hypothetical protein